MLTPNSDEFKRASTTSKQAAGYVQVKITTPNNAPARNLDSKSRNLSRGYGRVHNGATIWMHVSDIAMEEAYKRVGWRLEVIDKIDATKAKTPKKHPADEGEPKVNTATPGKQ